MEGGWRGGGLVSLVLAGMCLLLASGCGGDDRSQAAPLVGAFVTDDPAHTFAPFVYLHPKERYLPLSGKAFVAQSTLYFGEHSGCRSRKVAVGRREMPRLTEPPTYAMRPYEDLTCRRRSARSYGAEEITRPHQNTGERESGLSPSQGFFLDLDDAARGGAAASHASGQAELHGAATWYEKHPEQVHGEPGLRVTHWLLYGMHAPRRADGRPLATMTHEGDWERVDVLLQGAGRRWKPVAVRLFAPPTNEAEGRSREVAWETLRRRAPAYGSSKRTYPVLFAALGTHTLHPQPGVRINREIDLAGRTARVRDVTAPPCRACPAWDTSLPGFSLESQYWYGFGGGWGERGTTSLMTGPLGPRPRR